MVSRSFEDFGESSLQLSIDVFAAYLSQNPYAFPQLFL